MNPFFTQNQNAPQAAPQQYGAPQAAPQQYGGLPNYGAAQIAPQTFYQGPTPSLDSQAIINYAAQIPFMPYKASMGAEGQILFRLCSFRMHTNRNNTLAYRALIDVHSSTAPGIPAGRKFELNFEMQPKSADALASILGKMRALLAAIVGANANDPAFQAEVAKAQVLAASEQAYFEANPMWIVLSQMCRKSKNGVDITDQTFTRVNAPA